MSIKDEKAQNTQGRGRYRGGIRSGPGGRSRGQEEKEQFVQQNWHERERGPWRGGQSSNSNVECFKCGKYGHYAHECYSGKCFSCGKSGHFAKDCRSESRKEETINLTKGVEEEATLLKMACSSGAEHKQVVNLARRPSSMENSARRLSIVDKSTRQSSSVDSSVRLLSRLHRMVRHADSPHSVVEHVDTLDTMVEHEANSVNLVERLHSSDKLVEQVDYSDSLMEHVKSLSSSKFEEELLIQRLEIAKRESIEKEVRTI